MDPVMIRPPGIDNGAFVLSPESIWYARVLLSTLDPSLSIVPLYRPWKRMMILKMVIMCIIHIITRIAIICFMTIIAIIGIMTLI